MSVIVPVYNAERYLHNCIRSIINQTYKCIEIILINDGSSDNSLDICNEYAAIDKRIRLFHQINRGVAVTRNNALNLAKGEYILFVDSDDYIHKELIEKCVDKMQSEDISIVCFSCAKVTNGKEIPFLFYEEGMNKEVIIRNTIYNHNCGASLCDKFFRKTLWDGLRFRDKIKCEDSWIFPSLFSRANRVVTISEVLYFYNIDNTTSIMHTIQKDVLYLYYEFLIYLEYEKNLVFDAEDKKYICKKSLKQALKVYNHNIVSKCLNKEDIAEVNNYININRGNYSLLNFEYRVYLWSYFHLTVINKFKGIWMLWRNK